LLAAEANYIWCMMFIKLSLGVFFLRILIERWQRLVVIIMVTVSSVVGFAYFWYILFQCGVPNAGGLTLWEKRLAQECNVNTLSTYTSGYFHNGIQVLTDVSLLLVPVPTILGMQISRKEKVIVLIIFAIAVL
jgi:hypothetical protein